MKRTLSLIGLVAVASANANLWVQNQLINVPGGAGVASKSQLETNETIFGFGAQSTANNTVADDFTLTTASTITGICLYTYQTGATTPTITGANWGIGSAAMNTGLTAWSGSGAWWNDPEGDAVYRVDSTGTGTTRRIVEVVIPVNITLGPGTYWLSYNLSGSLASGPWAPPLPTSLASHGQNAVQSIAGGAFAGVLQGPAGADLAFVIKGQPVPEPATLAVLGLGAAAVLRRRRK